MKTRTLALAGFAVLIALWQLPAAADDPKDMTADERRAWFDTLSDEEQQAVREKRHAKKGQRRQEWENLSDEEREAIKEKRRAKREERRSAWEELTPEEREAKKAERKARRDERGTSGEGRPHRGKHRRGNGDNG